MAASATPPDNISSLVSAINHAAETFKTKPQDPSRLALRAACLNLWRELESPPEAMFRVMFGPMPLSTIRIAIEAKWLDMLASAPDGTLSAQELATRSGAEKALLIRIMAVLVTEGLVLESSPGTYSCNHVTRAFTWPGLKDATVHAADSIMPSLTRLPLYMANTGYKEPQDDSMGPYTFAHGRSFWNLMKREPERRKTFNMFMQAQKKGRGDAGGWLDVFPMEERLNKRATSESARATNGETSSMQATNAKIDAEHQQETSNIDIPIPTTVIEKVDPSVPSHGDVPGTAAHEKRKADAAPDVILQAPPSSADAPNSEVLIVDMGAGDGHELLELQRRFGSKLTGRTIMQDLPESISHSDVENLKANGVEVMAHDFFTPQPVKGAEIYYMASIIHDYSDENCLQILRNIVPAMKVNHSSIVVVDLVVPESDVPGFVANVDITLMAVASGKERSRAQLAELCEKSGLRVRKDGVHMLSTGMEGAVEIVLKEDERE